MKRFILYTMLFLGCFLLSDLLLVYITKKSFDEEVFQLPSDKQVLILGDSHLECALNDTILNNAVNLCSSGEAYIYTYVKMKQLLAANSQVKTVWLSFNFSSLSVESDEWLYNKEGVSNIDRYVCFFEGNEKAFFLKNIRYYLSLMRLPYNYRSLAMRSLLGFDNKYPDLRWGGYLHLDKNNLRSGGVSEIRIDPSSIQYIYFNKIVEYLSENNINLILINSPIKNKKKLDTTDFHRFTDRLESKYTNMQYWDYTDFPLPDSCYADAEHLNYKGAEIFSAYLME